MLGLSATAGTAHAQSQQALQFDGINDYVTFGAAPNLGASTFTIEVRFKRTGAGVGTDTGSGGITAVPLISKGRSEADGSVVDMNYFLGIDGSSHLVADYEEGTGQTSPGLNHPVTGAATILDDVWYHAAATFDGTTLRVYLNGVLDGTLVVGAGHLPQSASTQHAGLATAMTSTGLADGFFQGLLDEARIWNVARSPTNIQNNMDVEVLSGTGLIGRWGLNEGGGTSVGSSIAGSVAGTLTNGPTWTTDSPIGLAPETALRFAGTNAYVAFGNPASLQLTAVTIEMWIRRDGAGVGTSTGTGGIPDAIPLVAKGRSEIESATADVNYLFGIRASDGVLCADFEEGPTGTSPSLNHPVAGVTPIANGVWHHVAATYDGTTWKLYLDGALEVQLAVGQPLASASTVAVSLASALNSTNVAAGFFNGAVDEVRIWDVAHTQAEIQSNMNLKIGLPTTGLVARWGLDEDALTTVSSTAGTAINGTITGTGWSWAGPAPFTAGIPNPPTHLTAVANGATQVNLTWTDASTDETSFEIERSTAGSGGPFAPLATVAANTVAYSDNGLSVSNQYCYQVRAVNGSGASSYAGPSCATTVVSSGHALDFAGITYVTFGDPAVLHLPQFTVECWFRRDGTGTTTSTGTGGIATAIPLVTKGTSEADGSTVDMNYFLGINTVGNVLCADFEEGAGGTTPGLNHPVVGFTAIANGVWHHAAATYDGDTWNLYLDGNLEARLAVGQPCQSLSIQRAALASSIRSTGVVSGYFDGALDEVRIWNYTRDEFQIQGTANAQITTSTSGLVARWALDEGSGTAVNGSAGTSVNGSIVGPNFSWAAGAPFNLPFNLPPGAPIVIAPPDSATEVSTGPSLYVSASDPDGGDVTVTWYGRPLPGGLFQMLGSSGPVPSGSNTAFVWSGLTPSTDYEWYATVSDGITTTTGPTWRFTTSATVGVEGTLPGEIALVPIAPNPAHGHALLTFALPRPTPARLSVLDIQGREVAVLADGPCAAGRHSTVWNGRTPGGTPGSGLYLVRLQTPGRTDVRKMVWAR